MAVREVNWLELPDHLTVLVTEKLSRCDFIRFGAVCKPWLSILVAHPRRSVLHQLPLLLLPSAEGSNDIHSIYECIEKRIYTFEVVVPNTPRLCGSSHGWLVTIWKEDQTIEVLLTNPFVTAPKTIKLPPLKDIVTCHVKKAVLSANPASNPNYVVMLILRQHKKLAFFKPSGDKADWTYLATESEKFDDILYYCDQFYLVDISGTLFACDVNHPHHPRLSPVLAAQPYSTFGLEDEEYKAKDLCLAELSSGDLILVKWLRKYTEEYYLSYTLGFSVYKMNPLVDLKWVEVQNLCGDALFLGECYSSSFKASDFPGCKPNCIYFIDYGYFPDDDNEHIGIFNLEDGSIERQCPPTLRSSVSWCPPIWIEPTPLWQR